MAHDQNIEQFAAQGFSGVDRSAVTRIETGERRVDIVELQQICEVMGISLVDFVKQYEERTRNEAEDEINGTSK